MSSLQKKGDWYYLQFFNPEKSPTRKKVSLKTRRLSAARKLQRRLEDAFSFGDYDPWVATSTSLEGPFKRVSIDKLEAGISLFIESKQACRKTTVDHYRWVLNSFARIVGSDTLIMDISVSDIAEWLESSSLSDQSVHTYLSRLRTFSRFLSRETGNKDFCASISAPKPPDKFSAKLITVDDLDRIIGVAGASTVPYIGDLAIVTFFLALRLSEVCAIRRSWLDIDSRVLLINNDESFATKTGMSHTKPISERALRVLSCRARECARETDHVFVNTKGHPLNPKHTSKMFKRCVRAAKLPETYTFHGLRHGGLSHALQNGASIEAVRRFAGHATARMTMKYLHVNDSSYHATIKDALELNQVL